MPMALRKGTFRQQLVADREIPGPRDAAGHTKKGQREGVGTARWPFQGSKPV